MWLVTAVGPVHGQSKFTFVLQQGREYSIGRDDSSDIRYESRHVRPKEGTLVVEHWDPAEPNKPPSLRWRLEPKKSGSFGSIKTLCLIDLSDLGSTEREDYDETEIKDSQGCFLEKEGVHGIGLGDGMWFNTEWKDLGFQYDKIKDESEEVREVMRQYCIAWTQSFDTNSRPTIVLSSSYRSNVECNYAVCFAVRILLPSYLSAVINRLKVCWKKMADFQDSFSMPDQDAEEFQPDYDGVLPASRKERKAWLPDENRLTLFEGWKILGLRGKTQTAEKRYLTAMGADYQDIDILTKAVTSSQDFAERVTPWLNHVDEKGGREQAAVVWFSPVKMELQKKGIDYTSIVIATCQRLGVYHTHGGVLWGSVNMGGVKDFLIAAAANLPQVPPANKVRVSSVPNTLFVTPAAPRQAQSSQAAPTPASSQVGVSSRPDFIPSTFPDESENAGRSVRSPSPGSRSTRPTRRTRQATSPLPKERTPEAEVPAPTKKPLRRRAGRVMDTIPDSPPRSHDDTEDELSQPSQPLFSQADFVQDSMPPFSQVSAVPATQKSQTQSMVPDSIMPSQSLAPTRLSRLKRRAGGATPSLIQEIADTSINIEQSIKDEEKAEDIRQLYEETKVGSFAPSISKRPRNVARESEHSDHSAEARKRQTDDMDIDVGIDGIKAGKNSRSKRAASEESIMPPPAQRRKARSPSAEEEEEVVESRSIPKSGRIEQPSPIKSTKSKPHSSTEGPSKDEAFLQAIKKSSKSRQAVDELDKEFNQLRIPKPNGTSSVVKANEWNASVPDYALLNDFDDELRGNFIQIVRKDLFRRDLGKSTTSEKIEDGRPNFKKFKKKNVIRREPINLALAGPTMQDAEMGEPYWPTQVFNNTSRGRTQASQVVDEDEDMPLLPRSKKRLLGTQVNQDEDEVPSTSRLRKQSRVPETQLTQTQMPITTKRRTRAQSVLSEADSAITSTSAATSTRAGKATSRGKNKEPILLEDSDDEEEGEGLDWGDSTGLATNPRSTRTSTQSKGDTGTGSGTKTLGSMNPPSISTAKRKTLPTQGTSTRNTQASSQARRRLLPADDDDDVAFKGLGKKRRLG
ncbi:uncharacterized protein IL334_000196 [Kwoniella shivajii]|uniref:Uncharacterized protein n=1 Tax=Kwoniella shivajii TaxID=564305 RepID=A0ABZ1CRH9_9TREE|nr:hypothetical protein IL334_000196 [Kwoniella shivajii]